MLEASAIRETLSGLELNPWGVLDFLKFGARTEVPLMPGLDPCVSVSPGVFIILEKLGGDNFLIILLQQIWFSAINGPEISTFLPLASNITINGYTLEYRDDRWSEVLVSKNVLLFCSGNSLQVSTALP